MALHIAAQGLRPPLKQRLRLALLEPLLRVFGLLGVADVREGDGRPGAREHPAESERVAVVGGVVVRHDYFRSHCFSFQRLPYRFAKERYHLKWIS